MDLRRGCHKSVVALTLGYGQEIDEEACGEQRQSDESDGKPTREGCSKARRGLKVIKVGSQERIDARG